MQKKPEIFNKKITKKFLIKREVSTILEWKKFFKKNMKLKVEEGRMRELSQLLCVFITGFFCINSQENCVLVSKSISSLKLTSFFFV
jgi:hypothetical protein